MTPPIPRPAADLSWIVETRGATLIQRRHGAVASIPYPYAGLWALLADGRYTRDRARDMMSVLLQTPPQEAEKEIRRALATWRKAGFLQVE